MVPFLSEGTVLFLLMSSMSLVSEDWVAETSLVSLVVDLLAPDMSATPLVVSLLLFPTVSMLEVLGVNSNENFGWVHICLGYDLWLLLPASKLDVSPPPVQLSSLLSLGDSIPFELEILSLVDSRFGGPFGSCDGMEMSIGSTIGVAGWLAKP